MKKLSISFLIYSLFCFSLQAQEVTNYFSIDSITFQNETYSLAWSSSADDSYFKHEYIRKQDTMESFNKMILIEAIYKNLTTNDLAGIKVKEIEKRKNTDPVANYQIFDNPETGEYLIDFLVSEDDLYEWNVYRFKLIETKKGEAVLLFGFCVRSFENAEISLDDFFPFIKENRMDLINKVANYMLPNISH